MGDHRHQLRKCSRNLLDTPGLGIPADEDGVHNGRSRSVDMNGSSHLRGARQHSRTGEISVKDRKPDGAVGIQLVVVIGENQGRFGLQRLCHAGIDPGQPFRKVFEAAQLGDVAGQFTRGPCGSLVKSLCGRWGQPPEPDIAEIHQFPVLDVAEVGRVREHGIQRSGR